MRIAYIAPYQGPELLRRRPILQNLGLAANVKMELIAEFLLRRGHEVEILSQGEIVENQFRFFSGFQETDSFQPRVPIHYASALPVRRLNGFWSILHTKALFKSRLKARRDAPFDAVIIYNLNAPQVACADYAIRHLGLPVVLEYEDDAFVDVSGKGSGGSDRLPGKSLRLLLKSISGCIGASPLLLSRVSPSLPQMLLRGVVGDDYLRIGQLPPSERKNWVVFSGTHSKSKGLESLITGWKILRPTGWELHIAGKGDLTPKLEADAAGCESIIFHGLLNRAQYSEFLGSAKIGINPHQLSATPGNVFAFKIIEYLAAGNHVVTTPMGMLEPEVEAGITYMSNNTPQKIADTLATLIRDRSYNRLATKAVHKTYGPDEVATALDRLLCDAVASHRRPVESKRR